ncbi:CPBP family intramembrane metalloprotease domain-containing protein [Fischerella thermalis CCMEE 5201]|nr:CPBP family intramembrane metalloprotease domain-containing protein [Fischerella thermalis CCMEE 5201]
MFFYSILLAVWKSSLYNWQSFWENAPSLIVVMAFFLAWAGCWFPIAALEAVFLNWKPNQPLKSEQKIPLLLSLYLLVPLIFWIITWLTKTPLSDYGFVTNISILSSVILGFSLGLFSLAVVFTCQLWLGWCKLEYTNIKQLPSILLPTLLIALFVGGIEELVFRGFLFTELEQDYSVWIAATISSLIFAVLHLIWEQQQTIPQLPGLWLMGVVLVLARFVDRGNLGLAWGLHSGWIWAIACIDTAQLIDYTDQISDWVTGKNKKPLAGVAGIVCLLLTAVTLWFGYQFNFV